MLRPLLRATYQLAVVGVVLLAVGLGAGLLLVGRHGDGPIRGVDQHVWHWFVEHRYLVALAKFIGTYLDAAPLGVICLVLTAILVLTLRTPAALALLAGYLGGEGLVFVIRTVIHRSRPISADYPARYALPGVHEVGWSFPSGHATGVTAALVAALGAFALSRRLVWPWVVAAVAGAYVACSRLDLGVHWFSDVTVGFVLGAAWGVAVALVAVRLSAQLAPALPGPRRAGSASHAPPMRKDRPRHAIDTATSSSGPDDGP